MLRSSANLSTYIDITIGMEISPRVCTTADSTHVTLEPNKMRLSGKENVQCYLSYTVVQCFPNPFPGSGSSANHKTTESVQAIRERKFPSGNTDSMQAFRERKFPVLRFVLFPHSTFW